MVKRLIYILLPFCLFACQTIPEDEQLIPVTEIDAKSNALLVEFTGFLCVNCPNAAAEAHSMQNLFQNNLVIVEMHPASNAFCQTKKPEYDLTCPEADIYYKALGGTATTAFPTGIIDWNADFLDYTSWSAKVLKSIMLEKEVRLQLTVTHTSERDIQISYNLTAQSADYQILLWLVEDNIISPQMMPDGSQNMAYVHNHVLRGSVFDDPWGVAYQDGKQIIQYTIPDSINGQRIDINNCSVVGVVLDGQLLTVQDVQQIKL